jgi:hypothetical protein
MKTPTLTVIFVISYVIMNAFTSVFGVTIDTLLLCYCEENEYNKGQLQSKRNLSGKTVEGVHTDIELRVLSYSPV